MGNSLASYKVRRDDGGAILTTEFVRDPHSDYWYDPETDEWVSKVGDDRETAETIDRDALLDTISPGGLLDDERDEIVARWEAAAGEYDQSPDAYASPRADVQAAIQGEDIAPFSSSRCRRHAAIALLAGVIGIIGNGIGIFFFGWFLPAILALSFIVLIVGAIGVFNPKLFGIAMSYPETHELPANDHLWGRRLRIGALVIGMAVMIYLLRT